MAGTQKFVQVVFQLVMREAGHARDLVAAGERQAQDFGPGFRIVVE